MGSVICIEIDMHDKAKTEEKFPQMKKDFLAKLKEDKAAAFLSPKMELKNGIVVIEINALFEAIAKKVMPTIKDSISKDFIAQAKADGLEASIECYLKEVKQ